MEKQEALDVVLELKAMLVTFQMGLEELETKINCTGTEVNDVADTTAATENAEAMAEESARDDPKVITITKEDVRAVMVAKSRGGKTAEVKAVLAKFGAAKLGEITEASYDDLMAELEAIV